MTRITKTQKLIADKYVNAHFHADGFDADPRSEQELIEGLRQGKVYRELLRGIEVRYVSMTSIMIASVLNEKTKAYKKGIYDGIKFLCNKYGIN